jgi:hypothetical protein
LAYLGNVPDADTVVIEETRQTTKSFPLTPGDLFAASEKTKNRRPGPLRPGAGKDCRLRRRVECVDDVGRDAAPSGHVVPVSASPFADGCALLAVDRATTASGAGTAATPTTDPTAGGYPLLQITAKFRRILGRKVNLIRHPVKPEFDCFIGGARTVEIIDQGDGHFLRHQITLAFHPEQLLGRLDRLPITNLP